MAGTQTRSSLVPQVSVQELQQLQTRFRFPCMDTRAAAGANRAARRRKPRSPPAGPRGAAAPLAAQGPWLRGDPLGFLPSEKG